MNFTDELNALTPNSARVVAVPPAPAPAPPAATSVADPHGFNNLGAPPKLPSNIVDIFGDSGNLEKVTLSGGATSQAQLQRAAQVGEQDAAIAAQVALAKAAGQAENPVSKVLTTSLRARTSVVEFPSLYNVRPSRTWKDMSFAQACAVIMPAEPTQCESKAAAPLIIGGSLQVAALSDAAQKAYDEAGETHDGRGLARSNANIYQLDMAIGDIDGRFTSVISELERLNISTGAYSSASYQPGDPNLDKGRVLCAVTRPIKPAELPAFFEGFNAVCLGALDEAGRKPAQGYVPYIATPTSTESIRKEFGEFALDVDAVMRIGTKVLGSPRLGNAVSVATVYKPSMERSSAFWQLVENTEAALSLLGLEGVDDGHSDWIRTGLALKEELGDREGFRLWNSWSEKFDSYGGLAETQKEWGRLNISEDCDNRGTCGGIISRAGNRAASYFNTVLAPGGVYVPPGGFGDAHAAVVDMQVKFLDFAIFIFPRSRLRQLVPNLPADLTALKVPSGLMQRALNLRTAREERVEAQGRVCVEILPQKGDAVRKKIGQALSSRITHVVGEQLYQDGGYFVSVEEYANKGGPILKTKIHKSNDGFGLLVNLHALLFKKGKPYKVENPCGEKELTVRPRQITDEMAMPTLTNLRAGLSSLKSIPVLKQITNSPTIINGVVLDRAGYHPKSCIYYQPPADVSFGRIVPFTHSQAKAAMVMIDRVLLKDFKFVNAYASGREGRVPDELSRSAAHSMLLTSALGLGLEKIPIHAVTAAGPGAGKSELTKLASILARGGTPIAINVHATAGKQMNEGELDKNIDSKLLDGEWILALDNVNGPFNSHYLSSLSSGNGASVRMLGASIVKEVTGAKMVTINGIKLRVDGDLADKTLVVGLRKNTKLEERATFAGVPSMEQRREVANRALQEFLDKVGEKRGVILPALLGVAYGYQKALQRFDAGTPQPMVEFDLSRCVNWDHVVRGPIIWATGVDPWGAVLRAGGQAPEKVARANLLGILVTLRQWGILKPQFLAKEVLEVCGLQGHGVDPRGDGSQKIFSKVKNPTKGLRMQRFLRAQPFYRDKIEELLEGKVSNTPSSGERSKALGALFSDARDVEVDGMALRKKERKGRSNSGNHWYIDVWDEED